MIHALIVLAHPLIALLALLKPPTGYSLLVFVLQILFKYQLHSVQFVSDNVKLVKGMSIIVLLVLEQID